MATAPAIMVDEPGPNPDPPEMEASLAEAAEDATVLLEDDTMAVDVAMNTLPDAVDEPTEGPGTLTVDVQPWADVFVDGTLQGRTPLSTPLTLDAGTYRIGLRHPQFPDYEAEVVIGAGEAEAVRVSLWDSVGRLLVEVSPWAVVLVDGVVRDTTPHDYPLIVEPGRHPLTLRHPQLGSYDTTFTIAPRETKTLRFNLNTLLRR